MIISLKEKASIKEEVAKFTDRMMELGCDSVQVIATALEKDGTAVYHNGRGNWYARRGAVDYWVRQDGNRDLSEEIAQSLEDDNGF